MKRTCFSNLIACIQKIGSIDKAYQINWREAKIIDHVCHKHAMGLSPKMSSLYCLEPLGSKQTIQKSITNLRARNFLIVARDPQKRSRKLISPSPLALARLRALDEALSSQLDRS